MHSTFIMYLLLIHMCLPIPGRNRESDLREKMLKNLLVENADLKRRLAETGMNGT